MVLYSGSNAFIAAPDGASLPVLPEMTLTPGGVSRHFPWNPWLYTCMSLLNNLLKQGSQLAILYITCELM